MKCNICGESPMGTGCYHICPNSVHYYSPEQERYDDQFYGDDDNRERYAATAEPSQYAEPDDYDEPIEAAQDAPMFEAIGLIMVDTTDDIPF